MDEKASDRRRRESPHSVSDERQKGVDAADRPKDFSTLSGIPTKGCYAPGDVGSQAYLRDLGFPGLEPFTRGVYPTMYRGRPWTTRQYAGFGTAEETNARFKYLLSQGQTGLSVAFDLPTQMGYDSDNPRAAGEVGRVGVAISSLEDMALLTRDIPLARVSTSMTINATAMILLALYGLVGDAQGAPLSTLRGTVQNDILKEYAARGTYIYPVEPAMDLAVDIVEWCSREMPLWNSISISGYHMREAGCNAVQEVAFTMANAVAYVERLLERGLDVDSFAPRFSFFFASQMDLLEEIAKFRAARRLWARMMKERFGAENPRSQLLRFHTQTAGAALTAQQPANNVVRVAIQALAAVLGGTQSLHANSMDEALSLPTEASARLALRTQQVIANESGVANTVDPVGGAYSIEALTDEIEGGAERYLERIQQLGGIISALEKGFIQREIGEESYRYQRSVEDGERRVVGVNAYVEDTPTEIQMTRIDPRLESKQVKRLGEFRSRREDGKVSDSLAHLREAAERKENLFPYVIEAARSSCSLGEISDALRDVYGEFRPLREF